MARLRFTTEWQSTGSGPAELRQASAFLTVLVGNTVLTRNEDLWSRTLRDSVLVSAYPLACWLAQSWWRLNWEPLPEPGTRPDVDWRMAHEMGAANHGYVWPHVVFASDNEVMQVWASAPRPAIEQSVRYLSECAVSMPLDAFRSGVDEFVDAVLQRLAALGQGGSDLAQLWELVHADRQDPMATRYRRIEAALGYDPDDCPRSLIDQALKLERELGNGTLTELLPLYGKFEIESSLGTLQTLSAAPGVLGKPAVPELGTEPVQSAHKPPWVRAVEAARALRHQIGAGAGKLGNTTLQDLLGLTATELADVSGAGRRRCAVGVPQSAGRMKFLPRKPHPVARRFEWARFIADWVQSRACSQWLASTDLSTARQKYQRAFAAEFLCPIDELTAFLAGDYSESGIEDAAQYFDVSERTVESLLANHGLIVPKGYAEARLPYALGVCA